MTLIKVMIKKPNNNLSTMATEHSEDKRDILGGVSESQKQKHFDPIIYLSELDGPNGEALIKQKGLCSDDILMGKH